MAGILVLCVSTPVSSAVSKHGFLGTCSGCSSFVVKSAMKENRTGHAPTWHRSRTLTLVAANRRPVVPFVGMMFDDLEVAKEVYNDYEFKLGFGIHIGNTKYSQARGATKEDILSRVFECIHAGKPINAAKKSTSMQDAPVESNMSIFSAQKSEGKQAAMMMDVKDTRQRNKYELCQNLMLDREDNSGFTMETTTTTMWGSWSIEAQGVNFYTREVFDRFQKILQRSTGFFPLWAEVDELSFDLVPNPGLDLKTYRVQVGFEDDSYTCGCNQFEMCGLLWPHIIRVMVHMNIQRIPERYMMHRWSIAATTHAPDPQRSGTKFATPGTNTLKYNSLCQKMNRLEADACVADDTYAVVTDMIAEARRTVVAMHRARNATHEEKEGENAADPPQAPHDLHQQQQEQDNEQNNQQQQHAAQDTPASSNLRNPARIKPKGRPSEKEQRSKSLIELRDEANKKRRKKAEEPKKKKEPKPKRQPRIKKCPFCKEEGHPLKECELMKIAKEVK
ncbi:hypothetical protein ACQ4PT_001033 [Festuca glaucescens]